MRRSNWIPVVGMALAAMTWADTPARPGTVNYVEGQVALGGQTLDAKSTGQELGDRSITTLNGKVEILLTPGAFLRLGPNTSAKLVSASLTDTQVQLEQGRAMIEVDQIFPENHLRVMQGAFAVDLTKKGLYDFDVPRNQVRVFDGEAVATYNGHRAEIKGGHELTFVAGDFKPRGFDKKAFEDDLYNWGSLRSSYLAEANIGEARVYAGGPGFFGGGWYFNPWYSAYTFIPGDGFFYSPFGWGFYSPWFVYRAPVIVGYYGGYHSFARYAPPAAFVNSYRGGGTVAAAHLASAPAFHSMGGGGFRGGRR